MQHTLSILARQALTAVLVVCVSVCCCHAGLVVHGLSGLAPDDDAETACASDGCCSNGEREPAAPQDDEAPTKRCSGCCVKGTGLEAGTLTLPRPVALPAPTPTASVTLLAPPPVVLDRPQEIAFCVDPPTLLRLRCALVV